jgi:hypothetical protein
MYLLKKYSSLILLCAGFLILSFYLVSCKNSPSTPAEKPVARAFDSYLYSTEFSELLMDAKNKEDSLAIIQNYMNNWAKKKVLLELAKNHLSPEDLDVSKQLEDYKTSLLIYRYQQAYIAQKLDTNVSQDEINDYYKNHENELTLSENIVKAFFIQVPRTFNQLSKLKSIYKSEKTQDIKVLDVICNKYAYQCNDFNNNWISFDKILSFLPSPITNQKEYLANNKSIEATDSNYVYLVYIKDYKVIGDLMPKEWGVSQVVVPNVLIQRKLKLLKDLEKKSLYDYMKKNEVEFFYP